ncbi:hypothetical protein Q3O60_03305 [Alkalimonas collagenimarina]|uniref:Ankyrin repeat domain-containing protein n=1 Tax=Alkalimonas collagenimarina TaxID=400390 RepID=A0ABT9GVY5_9GAMM|nr:hypothetical protein [Alkalimonas collagenimarina]MDP4535215.1 hypothetical protein [Alkalimonas collagenimarina]
MKKLYGVVLLSAICVLLVILISSSDSLTAPDEPLKLETDIKNKPDNAQNMSYDDTLVIHQEQNSNGLCTNFPMVWQDLNKAYRNLKLAEEQLYDFLIESELHEQNMHALFHAAGFSVHTFRNQNLGYTANNIVMHAFESGLEPVPPSTRYQLMLALATGNQTLIADLFDQGALTQDSTFDGWSILSSMMMHGQLERAPVQQIMHAGTQVMFADLIFASFTRQSPSVLAELIQRFNGDIHTTFIAEGRYYNLATLSAEILNYDALTFWSGQGISNYVEYDFYSSLDILPVPANEVDKKQAEAIVQFLARQGVTTNQTHTLERLNRWSNGKYQDILAVSDLFEQLQQNADLSDDHLNYLQQMRQLQSYYYTQYDLVTTKMSACMEHENNVALSKQKSQTKSIANWFEKISEANQFNETDIAALTMAVDTQYVVEQGSKDAVIALLEKYGSLGGEHPEFDQVIFISLLNHQASTDQLITLANYTPLPEHAAFALLSHQRIEDIAMLKPYGLRLDVENHGMSLLDFAHEIQLDFAQIVRLSEVLNIEAPRSSLQQRQSEPLPLQPR